MPVVRDQPLPFDRHERRKLSQLLRLTDSDRASIGSNAKMRRGRRSGRVSRGDFRMNYLRG